MSTDSKMLFEEQETPKVHSVTEITRAVREVLETAVGIVWVQGEIGNYRKQASGHQYFTLKDEKCQLPCVLFHRPARTLKQTPLADGMMVQARGELTVYEARGQYQLNVSLIQAAGVGLLQARFEALKKKLMAEGLFETGRKRELPRFPKRIGIVTSPTGAALRDMLTILERRAPWIQVLIHPVRVQGAGAAAEIAQGVELLGRLESHGLAGVEIIVVTRGGGSAEDLWEFNEEALARAIYASPVPVVSAVGHEIDFTIADFVADLRAATPSAAAELVAPDSAELEKRIRQTETQMRRILLHGVEGMRSRLAQVVRGALLKAPRERLEQEAQRIDLAQEKLARALTMEVTNWKQRTETADARLRRHRPDQLLLMQRQQIAALSARLSERVRKLFDGEKERLIRTSGLLRVLAPEATLERGYSITMLQDGTILHTAAKVRRGMKLRTRLSDGEVRSEVE